MEYLLKVTGRLPAIRGLDYIYDDYEGGGVRSGTDNQILCLVTDVMHI